MLCVQYVSVKKELLAEISSPIYGDFARRVRRAWNNKCGGVNVSLVFALADFVHPW